jgi:arylsulfatase A-like enzyme
MGAGIWNPLTKHRPLDAKLPMLGKLMKQSDYATCAAGKWQLAHFGETPDHPQQLGFDEYCLWTYRMHPEGENHSRFWKPKIWENGAPGDHHEKDEIYGPDVFCNFILNFMERNKDQPFFAYYPMVLMHRPYMLTTDSVGDKLHSPAESTPGKNRRVTRLNALHPTLPTPTSSWALSSPSWINWVSAKILSSFSQQIMAPIPGFHPRLLTAVRSGAAKVA